MTGNLDIIKQPIDLSSIQDNSLVLQILGLLNNNTYTDTTVTKNGVTVGGGHRASDTLRTYLQALAPSMRTQGSAEELLLALKNKVADIIPVKASNEYEFSVLLSGRNNYRDEIQWDKIIHDKTHFTLPAAIVEKNVFLDQNQIDLSQLDANEVYQRMGQGDYGTKLLDVPYVTQSGAKKLFDAGVPFLTSDDMADVESVFGDARSIFTKLIMQKETGRRIDKGQHAKLRSAASAVWMYDRHTDEMKPLTAQGYIGRNDENMALPIIAVKK